MPKLPLMHKLVVQLDLATETEVLTTYRHPKIKNQMYSILLSILTPIQLVGQDLVLVLTPVLKYHRGPIIQVVVLMLVLMLMPTLQQVEIQVTDKTLMEHKEVLIRPVDLDLVQILAQMLMPMPILEQVEIQVMDKILMGHK